MMHPRFRWTAVAMFAAVMTVAEVFALSAAARDARRWLDSDQVREVQQAGRAVAAAGGALPVRIRCARWY